MCSAVVCPTRHPARRCALDATGQVNAYRWPACAVSAPDLFGRSPIDPPPPTRSSTGSMALRPHHWCQQYSPEDSVATAAAAAGNGRCATGATAAGSLKLAANSGPALPGVVAIFAQPGDAEGRMSCHRCFSLQLLLWHRPRCVCNCCRAWCILRHPLHPGGGRVPAAQPRPPPGAPLAALPPH